MAWYIKTYVVKKTAAFLVTFLLERERRKTSDWARRVLLTKLAPATFAQTAAFLAILLGGVLLEVGNLEALSFYLPASIFGLVFFATSSLTLRMCAMPYNKPRSRLILVLYYILRKQPVPVSFCSEQTTGEYPNSHRYFIIIMHIE